MEGEGEGRYWLQHILSCSISSPEAVRGLWCSPRVSMSL